VSTPEETVTATTPRPLRPVPVARLSDAPLPPVDPSIPPWPGETVRLGGVDLFVRRTPGPAGGGEPALYVHGLGGASTNWTDYAALLATRLDGEALDLPGFGRSGPAAAHGGYAVQAQARTVVAYLEHRGAGPVHLVGNSMGGVAALLVAATRPDLVRTLTLVSPAMPWLRPRRSSDFAMPLLLLPGIGRYAQRRLDALPPERRAAGLIRICFADPAAVPPNRVDEAVAEMARRQELPWATDALTASLRALARSYLVLGPRSLWKQAGLVQAPTLVVWGTEDRLVPVELAGRTAASVPGSRLLVLPNVGHVAQLEAPETTARATLALIEDAAG
jgi:pimeloyl-ACP methyl ester carboxylesterase